MGLFTTVLHIYETSQQDIVDALIHELNSLGLSKTSKLTNIDEAISGNEKGAYYIVTAPRGKWTTIIELNVNIDNPFYLYELTTKFSSRLKTFALSFHLHDEDVLFYNLDNKGNSIDGYNSNYQYFLDEPAPRQEIVSQRHDTRQFYPILPAYTAINSLDEILNEGYWNAFDNNDLDEDGTPNNDKYFVDELDRFERIGKYLEIYSKNEYPFADWYSNIDKLDIENCYILRATR